MGKIRIVKLGSDERAALVDGQKKGASPVFRKRCQIVLLKSTGRSSADVGKIVNMTPTSINSWLNRYESLGIQGLKNKPGQGRKPILKQDQKSKIAKAVRQDRQRLDQARIILEKELNKKFSKKTLQRFLKKISADTSGFA